MVLMFQRNYNSTRLHHNLSLSSSEVFGIRYTQNVNQLYLCHPNYPPYVLTLISATNWTLPGSPLANRHNPNSQPLPLPSRPRTSQLRLYHNAVDSFGKNPAIGCAILANGTDIRSVAGSKRHLDCRANELATTSTGLFLAMVQLFLPVPISASRECDKQYIHRPNINIDFSQGPPIVTNPFLAQVSNHLKDQQW